jgi:hypothetical protein
MITVPAVQGCTAAAVAYGVSKISSPKTEAAPPAPHEQRAYPEYLTEMERINLEREKAGLAPRPILTQEEWVAARAAGHPSAAPAPAAPVANSCEKAVESK